MNERLNTGDIEYFKTVRENSKTEPGFWTGKCNATILACGNAPKYVVIDEYFAHAEDAEKAGIQWGIKVCASCLHNFFGGARVVCMRQRVNLVRRVECQSATDKCTRHAPHFILLKGKRLHMCVNHIAIHSEWTDVFHVTSDGRVENVSDDLNAFYLNHQRPVNA
jgi:hypothetical protein